MDVRLSASEETLRVTLVRLHKRYGNRPDIRCPGLIR
jgi:hypothetical protein